MCSTYPFSLRRSRKVLNCLNVASIVWSASSSKLEPVERLFISSFLITYSLRIASWSQCLSEVICFLLQAEKHALYATSQFALPFHFHTWSSLAFISSLIFSSSLSLWWHLMISLCNCWNSSGVSVTFAIWSRAPPGVVEHLSPSNDDALVLLLQDCNCISSALHSLYNYKQQ